MHPFFPGDRPAIEISCAEFVETIPPDYHNELLERYARNRPVSFRVERSSDYVPPWQCRGRWSDRLNAWEFQVEPAWVNGDPVTVRVPATQAGPDTLRRLGASSIDTVDAWLEERPWIPIRKDQLRALGTDAIDLDIEPVPADFVKLGVRPAAVVSLEDAISIQVSDLVGGDGRSRRLLRAVDLVLRMDRPSLTTVLLEVAGETLFDVGLTAIPSADTWGQLQLEEKYEEPYRAEGFLDLLSGSIDDPFDKILIGTIYLLSPDGAPDLSDPDRTWSFHFEQRVFRSLSHDVQVSLVDSGQLGTLAFPFPLAGGSAQPIIDSLTEALTDEANRALQMLNGSTVSGHFWT